MFFKQKPKLDVFLQELAKQPLFVISMNQNAAFPERDGSAESMRNYLDRNAQETASDESNQLFFQRAQNLAIYPVFTSEEHIQHWLQQKPFDFDGATALTQLRMKPGVLFQRFKGAPPTVLMLVNPLSDDERFLTHEEIEMLAKI